MSELNDKQKAFCREFTVDCNGTQAAIRANYSAKTANEQAAQLLAKLSVRQEIDRLMRERSERTEIDADLVVQRYNALYLEALAQGDLNTAARCLEALGRHTGIFAKDNGQRKYTQADLPELERFLEQLGVSMDRKNAPAWLKERPLYVAPQLVSLTPSPPSEG